MAYQPGRGEDDGCGNSMRGPQQALHTFRIALGGRMKENGSLECNDS